MHLKMRLIVWILRMDSILLILLFISVIIDRSELICGNLGKKVLGSSKSGLFYSLNRDNSPEVAAQVMLRFSKLSSRWITDYGMTIGIGDVTPNPELIKANL